MKFELKVNDREYIKTVEKDKDYTCDLYKNNFKTFSIDIKKDNVTFKDENDETFEGVIIYETYDEWINDSNNQIALDDLDDEDISEDKKEFIYFIEATLQLFYGLSQETIWPDKWWEDIDLDKIINKNSTKIDEDDTNIITRIKKIFNIK